MVLVISLLSASTLASSAVEATDWISVKATVGDGPAEDLMLTLDFVLAGSGEEPMIFGYGWTFPLHGFERDVRHQELYAESLGGGENAIRATHPMGEHVVAAGAEGEHTQLEGGLIMWGDPQPGDIVSLLVFVPGMQILDWSVHGELELGELFVETRTGSGAFALTPKEFAGRGVAADVGSTAFGGGSTTFDSSAGGVGVVTDWCSACNGMWQSPDGTSRMWSAHRSGWLNGMLNGPSGTWHISWAGAGTHARSSLGPPPSVTNAGGATILAFVPVGDDRCLFDASPEVCAA